MLTPMRIKETSLLVLLCAVIVIVQSFYVGDLTLYSQALAEPREEVHRSILHNEPFRGDWSQSGANSINIRILTVYMAEAAKQISGLRYDQVYKLIDMGAMFLGLFLLFVFLRKWFTAEYALIAILFIGVLLPMTYALHLFHPWDRIGLLLWILFAWAVREDRFALCVGLVFVAVLNKYDAAVLPGLYFLAHITLSNWRRILPRTLILFAVGLGTYAALRWGISGGFSERDIVATVSHNLQRMAELNITYPPFLGFVIPLALAAMGWKHADRFSNAAFLMGVMILMGPLFLLTNFEEIRTEMGVLLLMLPTSLTGLRVLLAHKDQQRT